MTKQELKDYLYDEVSDLYSLGIVADKLGIPQDRLERPVRAKEGIIMAIIDIIAEYDYHQVLGIVKNELGYEPQ